MLLFLSDSSQLSGAAFFVLALIVAAFPALIVAGVAAAFTLFSLLLIYIL